MKYLVIIAFLAMSFNTYAGTLTITYTDEELKAVEAIVPDAQIWLQSAWNGKANKCMERVISEIADKNPSKLSEKERKDLIKKTTIKTRKQKDAE